MTKGITEKEPDPRIVYADIIDLPHHQSATRPHITKMVYYYNASWEITAWVI